MSWITYLLGLVNTYPDAFSVVIAALLSWAPGLILEQFLPAALAPVTVKRLTLSVTVLSAFTLSTLLWHWLDPDDSESMVGVVSFFAALCAPYVHIFLARALDKYVPFVSSVFAKKPPGA